jgi:predicted transcriptional regulator
MSLLQKREGTNMAEHTIERKIKKSKEDKEISESILEDEVSDNSIQQSKLIKVSDLPAPKPMPIPSAEEIKKKYSTLTQDDDDDYDSDLDNNKQPIQRTFEIDENQLNEYLKRSTVPKQAIIEAEDSIQSKIERTNGPQVSIESVPKANYGPVTEQDLQKVEEIYSKTVETFILEEYNTLTPLEKDILEIARSILKKKKYSSEIEADKVERCSELVQKLHEKCVAKLTYTKGYSPDTIFESIRTLEKKQWIVTEHRRTKKEILESEPLTKVLEFIKQNPGVHARHPKIQEELAISRNPFIKHVMVLEAFGLIRSVKIGRTQNYFFSELPDIFDDLVVLFQNDLIVNIINLILEHPEISLTKIAERLNVYHGAIQYHIKTLRELNIIESEEKSPPNRFVINKTLLQRYNKLYKVPPFNV